LVSVCGAPLVTGDITGSTGMDTLVFDGAGGIGFTPMAFENAIKQGAGTFTVASLPTMQRVEIKQGVLEVNSNYQFSNSGFFQTNVNVTEASANSKSTETPSLPAILASSRARGL